MAGTVIIAVRTVVVNSGMSFCVGTYRVESRMNDFNCTSVLVLEVCVCRCSVFHSYEFKPSCACSAVLVLKLSVCCFSVFNTCRLKLLVCFATHRWFVHGHDSAQDDLHSVSCDDVNYTGPTSPTPSVVNRAEYLRGLRGRRRNASETATLDDMAGRHEIPS